MSSTGLQQGSIGTDKQGTQTRGTTNHIPASSQACMHPIHQWLHCMSTNQAVSILYNTVRSL